MKPLHLTERGLEQPAPQAANCFHRGNKCLVCSGRGNGGGKPEPTCPGLNAGFLAQGQIRITLPKNSNKQTNKKSASKIRQFLVGTVGIRHLQNLEVGENARSDWRQNQLCGFAGSPKSESYAFQHLHQHCLSSFLSTDGGKTFPGRHTHCPGWWGPECVAQPAHTDTCLASRI